MTEKFDDLPNNRIEEYNEWVNKYPVSKDDFERHGYWTPRDGVIVRMWRHKFTKCIVYDNHPRAKKENLPIYPFDASDWIIT